MKYIEILKDIIEEVHPIFERMSSAQFSEKPSDDKWSPKEILGHLVDSAFNNHRRLILAENQDNLLFEGYDQDQWVKRNNYQNRSKNDVLELWRISNLHFGESVNSLSREKLNAKTKVHSYFGWSMIPFEEGKEESIVYLIADYIYHTEHHIVQILPEYERKIGFNDEGYVIN